MGPEAAVYTASGPERGRESAVPGIGGAQGEAVQNALKR